MLNEWNWRIHTVSTLLQPRGCIFQNGFLGEDQFKKYFKKWTFQQQKSGVLFKKPPKNMTFHITWGSIQEWGYNQADTVFFFFYHFE